MKRFVRMLMVIVLSGAGLTAYAAEVPAKERDTAAVEFETPAMPANPPDDWPIFHLLHPGPFGDAAGDPNCAFYWKGQYHLHYIYNHKAGEAFAHVSSDDMVHWKWHPTVLEPSFTGHGMFSGTGFITKEGKPAIIYHGWRSNRNQIAFALDDNFDQWTKPEALKIKEASGEESKVNHWDPDCWLNGDTYYAISGGNPPHLMKSGDLKEWLHLGLLLHDDMPATLGVSKDEDVSCANMFKIGNKWMLLCISHKLGCRYYLGDFKDEKYLPDFHAMMSWNGNNFFAPESVLSKDGRRVMWAWLTGIPVAPQAIQSLPRELELPDDGVLRIKPLRELESLRYDEKQEEVGAVKSDTVRPLAEINGNTLEMSVVFKSPAAKEAGLDVLCDKNGENGLRIAYIPETKTLRVGKVNAPFELKKDEDLALRIFIDKNLVEVFANDRLAPVAAEKYVPGNTAIRLFSNGGDTILKSRVVAWKMKSAYAAILAGTSKAQTQVPKPFGPVPNENQLKWQEMEYYSFLHFSLNTFTDQEWGGGDEDVKLFNPKNLDCRQWARVCKEAGMKGINMVVKHHCGFCLWPSKYTEFSVKTSPWKDGKGDVVRELADACKEYGLKLGIYLSPWDRNSADYGKPEYITYFRHQLTELLTNYGPIYEVWFDGANGGSGYYGGARETRGIDRKTYYDWQNTYKLIRKLQPDIMIWNDGGDRGDLRWVGTEEGYVGETNWSLLNAAGDVPEDMLRYGVENGDSWVPGEVNTSIRPGWFYHTTEDNRVKTLPQLMNTYYNSIGRNGTLLLNFPIDTRGLIHENDVKASKDFAAAVKEAFAVNLAEKENITASNVRGNSKEFAPEKTIDGNKDTYWATDDGVTRASLTIDFRQPTIFNRFLVQEYIRLGQRVKAFTVEAMIDGTWKEVAKATTIGYKRILRFPGVKATKVRFTITDSKSCPVISNLEIYGASDTGRSFSYQE